MIVESIDRNYFTAAGILSNRDKHTNEKNQENNYRDIEDMYRDE